MVTTQRMAQLQQRVRKTGDGRLLKPELLAVQQAVVAAVADDAAE